MICKQFLALFFWCHTYQIILNPLLQLLALGLSNYTGLSLSADSGSARNIGYVAGEPILVEAEFVTLSVGQEIVLRCNIPEQPLANFTWYKKRVYPLKANKLNEERVQLTSNDRYLISNNALVIKSSNSEDVGDYTCRYQGLSDIDEPEKEIKVRPKPYIMDFDLKSSTYRSAIVEEGEPLKIPCNVNDEYVVSSDLQIRWYMSKYDENDMSEINSGEDDIELVANNNTSVDLKIGKVTYDHRRFYKCHVKNRVTENSKTIFIRVKSKYTVIWPAVGIVLELVILIGVIIVVENRRVEPDKGAYDPIWT